MVLSTQPASLMEGFELPFIDEFSGTDYELFEDDSEFVLILEMPGFDTDEITVAWDDGLLNVAAEHVAEDRGQKRTIHRRFRFPKEIDEDAIDVEYTNGVLEVILPVAEDATVPGKTIPVEG